MNWERLLRGELSLTIDILIGFAVGVLVIHTGLADRLLSRLLPRLKRFGIGATLGAALTVSVGSSKAGAAVVASALDSGRISPRTAKWGTLLLVPPAERALHAWLKGSEFFPLPALAVAAASFAHVSAALALAGGSLAAGELTTAQAVFALLFGNSLSLLTRLVRTNAGYYFGFFPRAVAQSMLAWNVAVSAALGLLTLALAALPLLV